jgi:ABC-type nitrate/sulfonate/bicarbonate transport system substrate-binding protein
MSKFAPRASVRAASERALDAQMSRRRLLLGGGQVLAATALAGGAGSFLAACSSSSTSSSPSTSSSSSGPKSLAFQFNWITNVQFAGSYLAQANGYYKQAGLDVTLKTGGPTISVAPILQAGTAQVGVVDPVSAVAANAAGGDLVIVGTVFQKSPNAILSLASAPITTPKEMVGKKIGVGASSVTLVKAFCKANGIDYSSFDVVPIEFNPAPLAAKQVDGYMGFSTNEAITLEQEGHPVHVMLMADYGLEMFEDSYGVTKSALQDATSRELIKDFLTAEIKGWESVVASPAQATSVTINEFGKPLGLASAQQLLECQAENQLVVSADTKAHGLFWMSGSAIQANLDALKLTGTPGTTALFDNSLLAEIYAGKSSLPL